MEKLIKNLNLVFLSFMIMLFIGCKPEPVVLTSIEITSPAVKTEYCINEPIDTTGIEVTAVMNNGREVVSGWTVEFDNTVVGNTIPVKISYFGKEAFYTVIISNHIWNEGEVTTVPTCVTKGVKTYKCSICQEVLGTEEIPELYSSPVDAETGLAATSVSTYVYFGVFPKTVLPLDSTVTVDEEDFIEMGANTYYKGSDGEYYAKALENACATGAQYKYKNGELVKDRFARSYRYFKVEPIKWKVLTTTYDIDGEAGSATGALLLAEDILTANVPYHKDWDELREIDGKTVYPNNYQHSSVRAYLNGLTYQRYYFYGEDALWNGKGFLQTAFTSTAQLLIAETEVDNSDDSTIDTENHMTKATTYACENTTDKIFLLSAKEATTTAYGFAACDSSGKGNARIRMPTDYAKANYAYQNSTDGYGGDWWLRSPRYNDYMQARSVNYDGYAWGGCVNVDNRDRGLVPALSISL